MDGLETEEDAKFAIQQFLHALPVEHYAAFAAELTDMMPKPFQHVNGLFLVNEFSRLWARQDVPGAMAWARGLGTDGAVRHVVTMIAKTLAETDAAAAIKLLEDDRGGADYWSSRLMEKWARQDLTAARAAVDKMKGPHAKTARTSLLLAWVEQDPQAAFAYTETLPPAERRDSRDRAFQHLCQKDPAAAMAWYKSLPAVTGNRQLQNPYVGRCAGDLFTSSAQKDATTASTILAGLSADVRPNAVDAIAASWSAQDLHAAWQWAAGLTNIEESNRAMKSMAGAAQKLDTASLLSLAHQIPGDEARMNFLAIAVNPNDPDLAKVSQLAQGVEPAEMQRILTSQDTLGALAGKDPRGTADLLNHIKLVPEHASWGLVIERWADQDPSAAYAYVSQFPEAPIQWQKTALSGLAQLDPATALAKAQAMGGNTEERDQFVADIVRNWNNQHPETFQQAMDGFSGPLRTTAHIAVLGKLTSDDPAAAAAHWQSLQGSAHAEDREIAQDPENARYIAASWIEKNPTETLRWFQGLTSPEQRVTAAHGIARSWAVADSLAASEWIRNLPAGPEQSAAAEELVAVICQVDPQSALHWAERIQDPEKTRDRNSTCQT